ncbi:MAG: hypothetical protein RMK49_03765 [Abditibacteriales bacterium]|nr:hypothetical protein [Abditibacteriales bacterium]
MGAIIFVVAYIRCHPLPERFISVSVNVVFQNISSEAIHLIPCYRQKGGAA